MKSLPWSYFSSSLENRRKIVLYHQRVGGDARTKEAAPGDSVTHSVRFHTATHEKRRFALLSLLSTSRAEKASHTERMLPSTE